MRLLIQRVKRASVSVDGEVISAIGAGLLIFAGIETADGDEDIEWLAKKVAKLRIFADEAGVMNRDVMETGGEILCVSQFTLHAMTRKGNRPSYIRAAGETIARPLYGAFLAALEAETGMQPGNGIFGADMQVELVNDGPVTIWIDSKNRE